VSVRRAFELLADYPLLGREAEEGRRDLAPSWGSYGYIAKYRWLPADDAVWFWLSNISAKRVIRKT